MNDYNAAEFKTICANLGIETRLVHLDGRDEIVIDRDGINKLIAAGLLPADNIPEPKIGGAR
jgi:hypothetical protein